MTCTGDSHCKNGETATVTTIIDSKSDTFQIKNSPICIEKKISSSSGKKCYRFWSEYRKRIIFEHYVCATNAYYQPDPSLINNGAWLIADGIIQNGKSYFYWSNADNSRHLEVVNSVVRHGSSSGGCPCLNDGCQIIIKNENGSIIYQKSGKTCDVKVSCNGCPPGHIKCGDCCLPCEATAQKIQSLANKIVTL